MRRLVTGVVLVIALLLPANVLAHGGVQHVTSDAIITLYQEPLSPLKGEETTAEFIVTDKSGNRLKELPLTVRLIHTHFGDASKDREIFKKELRTNSNGMVSLTHTFDQADYYDIDFAFTVNNNPQDAGFLVQVRESGNKNWWPFVVFLALLSGGAGWLLARHFKRGESS